MMLLSKAVLWIQSWVFSSPTIHYDGSGFFFSCFNYSLGEQDCRSWSELGFLAGAGADEIFTRLRLLLLLYST